MRHLIPKLRYMCLLIIFNCITIPIVLRYWTCYVRNTQMVPENNRNFQILIETNNETSKKTWNRNCTPKKNIVFLKTHKTGGSTITNILNRYGEARDMNFVLPRLGENRLDWPWFFQKDSFYPLNGSEPNILCNHARYTKETMQSVMPNDTIYITILRDPIRQFESTFSYMTLDKILGMKNSTNPIEEFFKDPESVLVNYVLTQDLRVNSDRLKLIRNGMFYDLGLESKDFENKLKIEEAIGHLDERFSFVMMTEYFDESIVLLKRLLCWDLDDMVYFRMKQRTSQWKRHLSEPLQQKIMHWGNADVALYRHFNRSFWTILKSMKSDFWDEVKMLRAKNQVMEELCLQKIHHFSAELLQTAETKQFKLRRSVPEVAREMCKRMTWDEIKYLKHLREIQIEKNKPKIKKRESIFYNLSWIAKKLNIM